ncbi:MAG: zinc ribbon domain-containing protein [candidate division WOR-3 bacterium]
MPVFEFRCCDCNFKFEELILKKSEIENIRCPQCSSKNIEKLFSIFGFGSKGTNGESIGPKSACSGCQRTTCAGCK